MPRENEGCCYWGKGHRKGKCKNKCYLLYTFENSWPGHPPTAKFFNYS